MQLNMTPFDMIVSLIIGAIGSALVVLFSNKLLAFQRVVGDWWAMRSRSASEKRVRKLRAKLAEVELLDSDPVHREDEKYELGTKLSQLRFVTLASFVLSSFMISSVPAAHYIEEYHPNLSFYFFLTDVKRYIIEAAAGSIAMLLLGSVSFLIVASYYDKAMLISRRRLHREKITNSIEALERKYSVK